MKKCWLVLVTLWFISLFASLSAWAVKMPSLYQVEFPVSAQTADVKEQAIIDGFAKVLLKVSGNPDVLKNPVIRPNLSRAEYYVQEISYSLPTTDSAQFQIRIRYDAADVNRLLRKAGAASWGETRPLVLLWLVYTDKEKNSQIIDSETPNPIFDSVTQQSNKFGVPLILPMMDVTDISRVSVDDVKNATMTSLNIAAKRYSPDAVLIGDIEQTPQGAETEWQLILGDDEWRWGFAEKTADEAIAQAMDQVTQTLAKHYVVKKAVEIPAIWLTLQITNITQYEDISQIIQYLKRLSMVEQVRLTQVSGSIAEIVVEVRSNLTTFQQNAAIGNRLILKSQNAADNKLVYEWAY